jgi:predicted CXXCH cytochrome family protein
MLNHSTKLAPAGADKETRNLLCAGMLVLLLFASGCSQDKTVVSSENGQLIHLGTPSRGCYECHEDIYRSWAKSDHGMANRLFVQEEWQDCFQPARYFVMNGEVSTLSVKNGKATIETLGPKGKIEPFHPEMVLAHRPMVQFLIPFEGGRWQTTELAWDVNEHEWFNVYGEQHRRSEEWGHWSQRGMNWNAQCAICHVSYYEKNYDPIADAYASRWTEMGINCQQCHGDMPVHIANPDDPLIPEELITKDAYFDSCLSCHSRREDLTGSFRAGESYYDHHRLQLPVIESLYFPDGQIKDEVFEMASFLMSKMHHDGVRCLDCHDPHSLELKLPYDNNALCMRCHQSPGLDGAIVIDPMAHSRHKADSTGNLCVECHMPERTYMERDPRRDHLFHTPDPLLSKELGVPNACMDCHDKEGEGEEWVERAFVEWYGNSENLEKKRHHARTVQGGYERNPAIKPQMLELLKEEPSPVWRAAFAQMVMEMQPTREEMAQVLPLLDDPSPIVRSAVIQHLGAFPGTEGYLTPALEDPSRLVRLDASWHLRDQLPADGKLLDELQRYMRYVSDQPGGALRMAHYHAERQESDEALMWMQRVVEWDQTSADAWINYGLMLHRFEQGDEAITAFEKAHQQAPESVVPLTYVAMLLGEKGDMEVTRKAWERVLTVDKTYGRAWYNLGLLFAQAGDPVAAITYLDQGIAVSPDDPDIPYAKITLLIQTGQQDAAKAALASLLRAHPNYAPAQRLRPLLQQ